MANYLDIIGSQVPEARIIDALFTASDSPATAFAQGELRKIGVLSDIEVTLDKGSES